MEQVRSVIDRYAEDVPYGELTRAYLDFERPPGDDPTLLVAEAAAATTGEDYRTGIYPSVERFRTEFVETGRLSTFGDVAELDPANETLRAVFKADRKRRTLVEMAGVIAERAKTDDLTALRDWACEADHYRYDADPIGSIRGVGPSTFQYLRMLAGTNVARPDTTLSAFVDDVDADIEAVSLDGSSPLRVIASCEWLAYTTGYDMLEIDRIAWWRYTEDEEREAVRSIERC